MDILEISSADEMRTLGHTLSGTLQPGDVLVLTGPLGAGKTTFVQGLGTGLGVSGIVTSPTFVVARVHKAGQRGLGMVHVDAYRLESPDDVADLDIDDESPHITVIEWGDSIIESITDSWLSVVIDRDSHSDDTSPENGIRRVTFTAHGPAWKHRSVEVST